MPTSTPHVPLPPTDLFEADRHRLTFYLARSDSHSHSGWLRMQTFGSLARAYVSALQYAAQTPQEIGLFVQTTSGGFLYWASRHPTYFHSRVLLQAIKLAGGGNP